MKAEEVGYRIAQARKKQGMTPVSYTHLDVYKRQVWWRHFDEWPVDG